MNSTRLLFFFFAPAYLISWLIWLPLYLPAFGVYSLPVLPYHHALGAAGPLIAAFLFSYFDGGSLTVAKLVRSMFKLEKNFTYLAIALFSPFAILFLSFALDSILNHKPLTFEGIASPNEFPAWSIFTFFIYNLLSFGYGEETGWRGAALPKLQEKFNPFISSLILTVGWASWHIPLFFYRPGYTSMDLSDIIGWFFSLLTGSVLLSWLFNRSKSILVCAVFHATIDIAFTAKGTAPVVSVAGAVITMLGIVILVVFRKEFFYRNFIPEG